MAGMFISAREKTIPLKRRKPWLWSLVVSLLLAAQVALGVHQLEHRLNPDLVTSDDCALCHFASAATAGPEPQIIVPPTLTMVERIEFTLPTLPLIARDVAGFRSRAPPVSVSV
jgi:hypothetical protein